MTIFGLKSNYRNVCAQALTIVESSHASPNLNLNRSLNPSVILPTIFEALKQSMPLDKFLMTKACHYIQNILRQNPEPYLICIPKDLNFSSLDIKSIRQSLLIWSGRPSFDSSSFN
eukprot:NODE_76_length_23837_cov_1.242396.p20 type:complete len:116 gc:universal NODE_76_length_23837_cov_1.242396:2673-3020(+)